MGKFWLSLFLIAALLFFSSPLQAGIREAQAQEANLVTNGDFSQGLQGWTRVASGRGNTMAEVVSDADMGNDILEFERTNSGNDGGQAGVEQGLAIDISRYSELYLEADVKVISNTLSNSGWWSWVNGGQGELPVHLWLIYEDSQGKWWEWSHGFLSQPDVYNRANVTEVTRGQWYHYRSENLVKMKTTLTGLQNAPVDSPPPAKILAIRLVGTGWDFRGRMDNVSLTSISQIDTTPAPSPEEERELPSWLWIAIGVIVLLIVGILLGRRLGRR